MTTDALDKAAKQSRDRTDQIENKFDERLRAMDVATSLRLARLNEIPDQIREEVQHSQNLMEERFSSISMQFMERDTRQEREARDNKVAVDAAFAAQKEAAAKQDESNAKAIDKSEAATKETIGKLAELFTSSIDSIGVQISDLKERVQAIESQRAGSRESHSDTSQGAVLLLSVLGAILTIVIVGLSIYAATGR